MLHANRTWIWNELMHSSLRYFYYFTRNPLIKTRYIKIKYIFLTRHQLWTLRVFFLIEDCDLYFLKVQTTEFKEVFQDFCSEKNIFRSDCSQTTTWKMGKEMMLKCSYVFFLYLRGGLWITLEIFRV